MPHAALAPYPEPDVETVRWIAEHAVAAPSAHNAQPWRMRWAGGRLELWRVPERSSMFLDFDRGATWAAFGAVLENVELAARARGWACHVVPFPEPELVAAVSFEPAPPETDPLLAQVARRCTNRRIEPRRPLEAGEAEALREACASGGGMLLMLEESLDDLAAMNGRADRTCFVNPVIHHEMFHGFRWTAEEAERARDGLDVRTLELAAPDRAAVRLMSWAAVPRFFEAVGAGRMLEEVGRKAVLTASALALVVVPGTTRESYLQGGRAMQRTWLAATGLDLAVAPLATLPYFFARHARGEGFSPAERATLDGMRPRWLELFPSPPDHAEIVLLRIAKAAPPSTRSMRRSLDEVLEIGD